MKLNEIFLKDVNRSIEGVVKADDVDHLGVEVEEVKVPSSSMREGLCDCETHPGGTTGDDGAKV